jgi:hypothetical protein
VGNLEIVYRPIGTADASNLAITMLSVRRHETRPDQVAAFAQLRNFSAKPVTVTIEWLWNGQPTDVKRFEIPAEGSQSADSPLGIVESGRLGLRAKTNDSLKVDDEAWVAVNRPRRARV